MNSQKPTSTSTSTSSPEQPSTGKGMPAKAPKPQRSLPGQHESPHDSAVKGSLELPHDRDQAVDMTSDQNSQRVKQAAKDLQKGLKDTSKAPEMNQAYKQQKP